MSKIMVGFVKQPIEKQMTTIKLCHLKQWQWPLKIISGIINLNIILEYLN